ncbi:hypothetical protein BGZ76_004469, partial [Entomortierella beljakovae]
IIPGIVAQVTNILEAPKPIYPSLNKLCVYDTHGFFKEHVDTPKTNIFASLVVCLPTSYEGGILAVEDESFDLSSASSIKWCAFYSDCNHKIDEVTKGFRVTLTYDLLYVDLPELTTRNDNLYKALASSVRKIYEDNNIDPDHTSELNPKFVIGIPLVSKYPTLSALGTKTLDSTKPILKGLDRKILAVLHDLGYTTDIKAVYCVEFSRLSYYNTPLPPLSGLGDIYEERKVGSDNDIDCDSDSDGEENYYGTKVFVISDVWNGWTGDVDEQSDDTPYSALHENGGRVLSNIHWLNKPSCRHAGKTYIAYGNEASTGTIYMDGCILAYK